MESGIAVPSNRVAGTVTAAFLRVNGYRLEFDDVEANSFLIGIYETGKMRFTELETWLRQNAAANGPPI